ncbi:MAG: DNA cytosine methyltransferase [Promethearchaeota archaeon]
MLVVDLFCGMGGMSYGFANQYFKIVGYDLNKHSPDIYKKNSLGIAKIRDLSKNGIDEKNPDIIIGGPPCKPWSSVNITRRGEQHPDHQLLNRFFEIVKKNKPMIFIMENVLPIVNDPHYKSNINKIRKEYDIDNTIVKYSNFGSASNRRRLITAGFQVGSFKQFNNYLHKYQKKPKTIGQKIRKFESIDENKFQDHVWAHFNTIRKYKKYYRSGQFGWYRLDYNTQAPSFGNVMKTYTLHPNADIFGDSDEGLRVVSVREVMAIMGFPDNFLFPENMGHTVRYQMVADVVSPDFSIACAKAIKDVLKENE